MRDRVVRPDGGLGALLDLRTNRRVKHGAATFDLCTVLGTHLSHSFVEKAPTTVRGNGCLLDVYLRMRTLPPTAPTAAASARSPANLNEIGASSSRKWGSAFLEPSCGLRVCGDAWDRRECLCPFWWGRGMVSAARRWLFVPRASVLSRARRLKRLA